MEYKAKEKLNKVTHSVRASQAVLQYGVGAMVDFPEQTLMTAAPETWETSIMEIHDERLEKALSVDFFGMPGSKDESRYQNGVSYTRFPEWYFCPKCRSFKPINEWVKEYSKSIKMRKTSEKDPYMIRRLRCPTCFQDLVVARIVVACGHGHIDDFPWVKWVHAKNMSGSKKVCTAPKLRFMTSASSTEGLEGLTVACVNCNCKTTLKGAFDKDALMNLDKKTGFEYDFSCTGRFPWKNVRETCTEYPHVLQRGSSAVYFPVSESSLVIPPYSSRLTGLVQNSVSFSDLRKAISESLKTLAGLGIEINQETKEKAISQKIDEFAGKISNEIGKSIDQIKPILSRKWSGQNDPEYTTTSIKYRAEEYAALSGEVELEDNKGDFVREQTKIDDYDIPFVKNISLIHKVREVQALVGYSRLKPVDSDIDLEKSDISIVDIKEKETRWYPGYEVRGEGIFIEFDIDSIDRWRSNNQPVNKRVQLINENYKNSYYGSMKERDITAKYLLLHTISHLLMKQLSFECGYNIASIKERIYCSEPSQGREMSGILIYTASGDSEGTMGGLVRQGRPDVFPGIFKKAIESAVVCSNDPVCSLSQGQGRDSLNLSACYSCALVPETSCEEFNVFLDRGMVLGTFDNPEMGFYSDYVSHKKIVYVSRKENKKAIKEEASCFVSDYGMDLSGTDYKDIWKNLLQFSSDDNERNIIREAVEHVDWFVGKEAPYCNATICIGEKSDLGVDLLWKKSKVMLFSQESKEEYSLAKKSDWTCFCISDANFTWEMLNKCIMEK